MSKIMRQLQDEARAARTPPAPPPNEVAAAGGGGDDEYCTHGLLLNGTCLLCGRWAIISPSAPKTLPGIDWPFDIDLSKWS